MAVALAAIERLRDALDDLDYTEGLVRGFEEETGMSRYAGPESGEAAGSGTRTQ